jgi:RNA polymerase sigma-70 factor (ECF subfamily)
MVSRAMRRRKRREIEAAQIKSEWFQPPSNDAVDAQAVANAVASLPTDQREIVTAHIWGGLSFQAIGSIMGVSSSSTHRRYQEALETLRKGIGE